MWKKTQKYKYKSISCYTKNGVLPKIEYLNRYWHRIANSLTFYQLNISNAKTIHIFPLSIILSIEHWYEHWTYLMMNHMVAANVCASCFSIIQKSISMRIMYVVCTAHSEHTSCLSFKPNQPCIFWNTKCGCVHFYNIRKT